MTQADPNAPTEFNPEDHVDAEDQRTRLVMTVAALPPVERERAAEDLLRRPGVPGPATEHAIQHLVGTWSEPGRGARSRTEVIAKGADDFYAKQYRQYLNPTMGAFAATATLALIGAGTSPRDGDALREVRASMVQGRLHIPPIHVIDHQSVAVAIAVPRWLTSDDPSSFWPWVRGQGPLPESIRVAIAGQPVDSCRPGALAFERSRSASTLEAMDAALTSGKIAILALHPTDPDAMGLHITLFGVVGRDATTLTAEHGLDSEAFAAMEEAVRQDECELVFLVGTTEEVFTQCSQNLFIKRAPREGEAPPTSMGWNPADPLSNLINAQFELLQITVSASGLPGASPRNGDIGSDAYVVQQGNRDLLLIPYQPGNFIHGHAAKLWTNPYGAIVVHDDHDSLRTVILRGPSRVLSPDEARTAYPEVVTSEVERTSSAPGNRQPAYWFEQEIAEIIMESESLDPMVLDEGRATCTISAAGQARYGKKPAYFDAGTLSEYDPNLQHQREAAGRSIDPTGSEHRRWESEVAEKLQTRQEHLASIAAG